MKPYQILMGVALLGAGGLLLWGDPSPSGELAEPAPRHAAPPAAAAAGKNDNDSAGASADAAAPAGTRNARGGVALADAPATSILALLPRNRLLGEAGEGFGAGAAVFQGQNWNPPPPPPPKAEPAPPPPPPTAPPLPYTILGKAVSAGAWEVFLARGDKTYVARLNEVIDGTYRVDRIAPPLLMLTYLPLNQTQQVNIGVSD
ncbi:hypothetical protein ACFOLJ_01160 [Rugamonas sp. CCM 8940]|uniref:hypothetical protein n=1 Tax=Rugamonas sp. CCM 8940 TaxID=2765359 RepID=UPI0018F3B4C0|nr:hypothetical protein [Rugamonas sp. CCM 8940]MBJ7311420.1 hypothetical protein [Rugamonas sp. CCM 8940]